MSVKGIYRDMLILSTLVFLIVLSVFILYNYFLTYDLKFLYIGLFLIFATVFGALARYRFVIDYLWTLLKRLR